MKKNSFYLIIFIPFLIVLIIAILSVFFCNSNIFYNIASPIATIIVAIIGCFFTITYQSKVKQIEIINRILNDRRALFDKVSYCINSRLFDYNRVLWAIENIDENQYTLEECLSILNKEWIRYRETVRQYNIEVRMLSKQILYIFGEDMNSIFYIEEEFEDKPVYNAKSIAGKFSYIHEKTRELKKQICSRGYESNNKIILKELQKKHKDLTSSINEFLAKISEKIFSQVEIASSISKMEQMQLFFPQKNNKTQILCGCPRTCQYKKTSGI